MNRDKQCPKSHCRPSLVHSSGAYNGFMTMMLYFINAQSMVSKLCIEDIGQSYRK